MSPRAGLIEGTKPLLKGHFAPQWRRYSCEAIRGLFKPSRMRANPWSDLEYIAIWDSQSILISSDLRLLREVSWVLDLCYNIDYLQPQNP